MRIQCECSNTDSIRIETGLKAQCERAFNLLLLREVHDRQGSNLFLHAHQGQADQYSVYMAVLPTRCRAFQYSPTSSITGSLNPDRHNCFWKGGTDIRNCLCMRFLQWEFLLFYRQGTILTVDQAVKSRPWMHLPCISATHILWGRFRDQNPSTTLFSTYIAVATPHPNILFAVDPVELLPDTSQRFGYSKVTRCHTAMEFLKDLIPQWLRLHLHGDVFAWIRFQIVVFPRPVSTKTLKLLPFSCKDENAPRSVYPKNVLGLSPCKHSKRRSGWKRK